MQRPRSMALATAILGGYLMIPGLQVPGPLVAPIAERAAGAGLGTETPLTELALELGHIAGLFPNARVLFSRRIKGTVLQAACDTSGGMLLAANGDLSTELVVLDTLGAVSWRRDLGVLFGPSSHGWFVQGANASALVVIGQDEETAHYLVLDQRGAPVVSDTTEHQEGYALSPSGAYYYRQQQDSPRIRLSSIEGRPQRVIDLRRLDSAFLDQLTHIKFVASDYLMARQYQQHYTAHEERYLIIKLMGDQPVVTDSGIAPPWGIHRFYTDEGTFFTSDYYRDKDPVERTISCYESDGSLRWSTRVDSEEYPRAVVASEDQALVAIISSGTTRILGSQSGQTCGIGRNVPGVNAVYEAAFSHGHVLASVSAGDGTRISTLIMSISDSGSVVESRIHHLMCFGVQPDRPVLGLVTNLEADSCLVAALNKGE